MKNQKFSKLFVVVVGIVLLGVVGYMAIRAKTTLLNKKEGDLTSEVQQPQQGKINIQNVVKIIAKNKPQQFGFHPLFSHSGRLIVFNKRYSGKETGLWVMNDDGSNNRQVVFTEVSELNYQWSPDDSFILFTAVKGDSRTEIMEYIGVVNVTTGQVTEVFEANAQIRIAVPTWISNSEIAFVLSDSTDQGKFGMVDIYTPKKLTKSANGNIKLYFTARPTGVLGEGIVTEVKEDGSQKQLSGLEAAFDPTISPDGKEMLYRRKGDKGLSWAIMNTDGSNKRGVGFDGERISWSPDGKYILLDAVQDDGHRLTSSDVWVVNKSNSEQERITESSELLAMEPSWSPDGKRIVFVHRVTGEIVITDFIPF